MNTLTINGKTIGQCSRPRERGYGNSAYVFLMKEGYYVTIERSDIIDYYVDCDKNSNDCNYVFKLMN
jgi:hypothetical protein